jgi:cobalt-precorrin-5B (C1)-methyltransferase
VTDGAIDLLRQTGCWNDVMASITQKIDDHLQQRGGGEILIGAMIFSNQYGVLSQTVKAAALLECQRGGKK